MTGRLMVPGLAHKWGSDDVDFFSLIDKTGGWPVGYRYVGFEHTESRAAGFTNSPHNDGWWTVLYEADDYYTWKLSAAGLQRIVDAVHSVMRNNLRAVDAGALRPTNSRGYSTSPKNKS